MPISPSDQTVITKEQVENTHAQNIAQSATEATGQSITAEQVKPTTPETPIQAVEEGLKDLGYITEADLKQGDPTRTTESRNPLQVLVGKLMRKKSKDQDLVEK